MRETAQKNNIDKQTSGTEEDGETVILKQRGFNGSDHESDDQEETDGISSKCIPLMSKSQRIFKRSHEPIVGLLFIMALLVYFDRGAINACIDKVRTQMLDDNKLMQGAVVSAFMYAYCIAAPLIAYFTSGMPPFKVAGLGMIVWALAAAAVYYTEAFSLLFVARGLSGIGEAPLLVFSPTIIDSITPHETRSFWLAIFYMAIPLGYGLGYFVAGQIVTSSYDIRDGVNRSWRLTFIIEALASFPFIIILLVIHSPTSMSKLKEMADKKPSQLAIVDSLVTHPEIALENGSSSFSLNQSDASAAAESKAPTKKIDDQEGDWKAAVKRVVFNDMWILGSIGYVCQSFVSGGLATQIIVYMKKVYDINEDKAGIIVGTAMLISGIVGSVAGGAILDKVKAQKKRSKRNEKKLLQPAFGLIACLSFLCFAFAAFFLINNLYIFIGSIFLTMIFEFAETGPQNNILIWSCEKFADRPLSTGLNTFFIHALGDALSPLMINWIVTLGEKAGKSETFSWNLAIFVCILWLLFGGVAQLIGYFRAKKKFSLSNK